MKTMTLIAAMAAALACTPALAGGKNALKVGAAVSTGKGGLVGTLLGSHKGHGKNTLAANVKIATGKNGVLGLVLGSGKNSHHGW